MLPRGDGDQRGGDGQPRGGAEAERDRRERREDEAGQHRVGDRLGRVALPVEDDPDAERAADDAEDQRARAGRAG